MILLSLPLALLVNALSQLLLMKYALKRVRLVPSLFWGFGLGFITLFLGIYFFANVSAAQVSGEYLYTALLLTISYCGFSNIYFHYVNIGQASIRINILRDLYRSQPQGVHAAQITELCSSDHLVETRLMRLLSGGHIRQTETEMFTVNHQSKMLKIALVFEVFKATLLPKRVARVLQVE